MGYKQKMKSLYFTLWDVGYGISIWIKTPNDQDHWIDLGRTTDFSPAEYVNENSRVGSVECVIISRPDKNHLEDLPAFRQKFGNPLTLRRNQTIPEADILGDLNHDYQKQYAKLDRTFIWELEDGENPTRSSVNGGVRYEINSLDYGAKVHHTEVAESPVIDTNNATVVVMLLYAGVLFICPGDIEPLGWKEQWRRFSGSYKYLIDRSHARFLVAPYRGHKDYFCEEMMQSIKPHAVFINDVWGESQIHPSYRTDPIGIAYRQSGSRKYFSTRRGGSVRISVLPSGLYSILQN